MMQIQLLPFPHCTLTPPNLTPSPHGHVFSSFSSRPQLAKLVAPNQHFPSWYFSSVKRVSRLHTCLKRGGGLVRIKSEMMVDENVDDGFYIRRCVELARTAIGHTSPNPMVGCVIVKDGKIVGEGFHPKAGQPHAEVFALRDAGELAENATAYVSLEPCNHYGRTPPCTEALIKAKVKRVVIGMVDPNPIVASKGVGRLRDAGIDVTVGVEEELCKRLTEAFSYRMLTGKPFVTLRYSLSVNGRFLDQLGEGASETGGYYSKLLQEYDAVILSASLTEKSLIPTSHEPGANQPLQIIVASKPCQLPDLSTETSKMIIFADKETATDSHMAQKAIETVVLEHINLTSVLEHCKRQGLCSVLLDMRGNFGDLEILIREAMEQNVLQKVVIEVLPFWNEANGGDSIAALNSLVKRLEVKNLQSKISNKSIVLEGYLQHR